MQRLLHLSICKEDSLPLPTLQLNKDTNPLAWIYRKSQESPLPFYNQLKPPPQDCFSSN